MKRYFTLYKSIIAINVGRFFAYRADSLWAGFITSGLWAGFNIFSLYLISQKVSRPYGWSSGELIMIACTYNVMIGIFGVFFTRAFNEFAEIIDKGRLEYFLLKPIDSQVYISIHSFEPRYIVRTIIGIGFMIFVAHAYHIVINPINVAFFALGAVCSIFLLYACFFILNTLIIWSPSLDNITEIFYSVRTIGRYPREMFHQLSIFMFVFLAPFVIFISTPTRLFLGKASVNEVVELVVLTSVMLILSRVFWKFALKNYTSASS